MRWAGPAYPSPQGLPSPLSSYAVPTPSPVLTHAQSRDSSSIRRYNEAMLQRDIDGLLQSWQVPTLVSSDHV